MANKQEARLDVTVEKSQPERGVSEAIPRRVHLKQKEVIAARAIYNQLDDENQILVALPLVAN